MPMTDDELRCMTWTRNPMTREEPETWVATRKAAGRTIDIATCEFGRWPAYDAAPYGVRELHPEMRQIGTNRFVRSPESRGWVWEGDLPSQKIKAMYDRIARERAVFDAATQRHSGWHRLRVNATKIDDSAGLSRADRMVPKELSGRNSRNRSSRGRTAEATKVREAEHPILASGVCRDLPWRAKTDTARRCGRTIAGPCWRVDHPRELRQSGLGPDTG